MAMQAAILISCPFSLEVSRPALSATFETQKIGDRLAGKSDLGPPAHLTSQDPFQSKAEMKNVS